MYFTDDVPAASFLNPAFSPENDFVIGLPFISGINIGFNNDFKLNEITQKGYGIFSDTLKFNFDSFYNVIDDKNKTSFEADVSMFYMGIRDGKNYYSVTINEKGFFRGEFDKRFVEFFTKGTKLYFGSESNLGGLSFNVAQYREYGLGVSRRVNKKLSYGAKLKVLFGRVHMNSENLQFGLKTSSDEEALILNPFGDVKISGPVRFETDTVEQSVRLRSELNASDYFFNLKNIGAAADIGIKYQYNNQLSLSASVIDIGFLRFSKKNYIMDTGFELRYEKDELTQAFIPGQFDYLSPNSALYAFRDSIPFMTTATASGKTQFTSLPVKLYLGANYVLNNEWTFGFVGKLYFLKNYSYSAFTVSAQTYFTNDFRLIFSNSLIRKSILNPGIGCIYKTKIIHAYFVADNIFSVIAPSSVKNLNLQLGINLLINNE
ncbi:MAG: hypothetical protein HQ541_05095 [Mariniphaga sp.]|nr:hypothetical protein [Mariniphaga sp.]